MTCRPLDAQRFWQFAIAHYRQPGVEPASLTLQDQYRGNVNLALLLHWLDTLSLTLPPQGLSLLLTTLSAHEPPLVAHRAKRRQLKAALSQTQYRALLDHELQLEQAQQQALIDTLQPMQLVTTTAPCNLRDYCRTLAFPASLMTSLQAQEQS